jgi:hypothetical protein
MSYSQPRAAAAGRASSACCAALLAVALAGCSAMGLGQPEKKPVDPNLFPTDYKTDVLTYLQTNPYNLVGTREASLSPPALMQFGTESRYFSCLRATSPNGRKDKLVVFFGGEINQFVDATGEQCGAAAYQPFPELPALLARYGSKK